MNIVVDHKSELRITAVVLVIFWGLAALLWLLTWRIAAIIVLTFGLFAVSERIFRVATQGSSTLVRLAAKAIGALLLGAFFGLLLLFHPEFAR